MMLTAVARGGGAMADRELDIDFNKLSSGDLSGLRAMAQEVSNKLTNLQGNIGEMRQEMNEAKATVKSQDGHITATVGPRGQLIKLELDPRIYRRPDSAKLAAAITDTIQKAAVEVGKRIDDITERYAPGMGVGEHTRGEFKSRTNRFDFITDLLPRGDER
jgi:DNA-binding protein YbaB